MSEINCPECGARIGAEFVASLERESRVTVTIHPKDGERLSASNVGGTISDYAELMETIGKNMGFKTVTLVDKITSLDDGGFSIEYVIARLASPRQEVGA